MCEPVLFQAYPGDSNGLNQHHMGSGGSSGDTITAVPGVFLLIPGDRWSNFVTAALMGVEYDLKNVKLVKTTPDFIQCDDRFPPIEVPQQGTAHIRLRWPLMYEAPGTIWELKVAYGTGVMWDDDGPAGPHTPSYYHEDIWTWKVDASLESMKLLIQLFREVPFALDEVPLISDEALYPRLLEQLDLVISLYNAGNMVAAGHALAAFEHMVMDACIGESPRYPFPTGLGTGIAETEENPACCKLLVDAEYVGKKLGIYQGAK